MGYVPLGATLEKLSVPRAVGAVFFFGSCACWVGVSGDLRVSSRRSLALVVCHLDVDGGEVGDKLTYR